MELAAYKGGKGGKFQPRPLRRPSPYDRPPSAARGVRLATPARSGSGWFSKLVDPALRFITRSSSGIISSVFRKWLRALPETEGPKQNEARPYAPDHSVDVPLPSESQIEEAIDGHNRSKNIETPGIAEIEQLVMQNKYTKAQVDYLVELMYSRAVEPTVSAKGIGLRNSASPVDIARAYMSSRLSKASSTGLQSRVFREDKSCPFSQPPATKPNGPPAIGRSVLPFSKPSEHSGAGYSAPKPHGRSAMYRMSRSPYFNADPAVNVRASNATASAERTPGSTSKSGGRQALKRCWSVFDTEHGSNGPIRRIRQKSDLISAANARFASSSNCRGFSLLTNESPSKLTNDMLNRRALLSMQKVDASQILIDTPDFRNAKDLEANIGSQLEKLANAQENSPSNLDVQGAKFTMAARPIICSADISSTLPATIVSQKKPAFQMTAPEYLSELEDEQEVASEYVQD